jgi:hypothetical protein
VLLRNKHAPAALKQLACAATELAHLINSGQEPARYRAPAGAPPLKLSSTLAEARVALLARGIRTRRHLAMLELAMRGVVVEE